MGRRRKDTVPKLIDVPIGGSWIPTTPAKPDSSRQQPICTNWTENNSVRPNCLEPEPFAPVTQVTQINWPGSGRTPEEFLQGTQYQTVPAHYSQVNPVYVNRGLNNWQVSEAINCNVYEDTLHSFDTWQAYGATGSLNHGEGNANNFSVKDLPFGHLLAMAHGGAASNNAVTQNVFAATCSIPAPQSAPQSEDSQYTKTNGNSSVPEWVGLVGTENDAGSSSRQCVTKDGNWNLSRPFFDLNSPPRKLINEALGKSISFQFEPSTQEKTSEVANRKEPTMQGLSTGAVAIDKCDGDDKGKGKNKQPQLHIDELCVGNTSAQLQENHKPDKVGSEETDLTRTPPQKPKRKKHRPKVVIEGQKHKNTPKETPEKTHVPQESTTKRKYVRGKGVNKVTNTPPEGQTDGTDSNNKDLGTENTPSGKRKYVRKNKVNKTDATLDKGTPEITETKTVRLTRSSCKRSLNFNLEEQVIDQSSSYCPSSNCDMESHVQDFNAKDKSRNAVHDKQSGEELMEKTAGGCSISQAPEVFLSNPLTEIDTMRDSYTLTGENACRRGKCRILFSNETHDKETNAVQVTVNLGGQWTANHSFCSNTCMEPEKQARGLKRQHKVTTAQTDLPNKNAAGSHYNSLQAYLPAFSHDAEKNYYTAGMHFPTIYKKKRTEKAVDRTITLLQCATTSSGNQAKLETRTIRDSCIQMTSTTNQMSLVAQSETISPTVTNPAYDIAQSGKQVFEDFLDLGPKNKITKKRSKGSTRVRDLVSLLKELPASPGSTSTTSQFEKKIVMTHELPTLMEALAADTSTMTKKKRSKKSAHVSSSAQNLYNYHRWPTMSTGPPLALTWKSISAIDAITEQLIQLDLNAESNQILAQKHNEFIISCGAYYQENALVPYQRGGPLIPFDGSFDQVKRRRPRAKVNLDDETTRVWRLLLENINNEGIDGTDEEKKKWWEEERRVFGGRADSFIARMHLVQGDRRFSPWKGSVVDSVVGVFLTQNVSDHLSSSAFMSLAAKFPLRTETELSNLHEDRAGFKIDEPEVTELEYDEEPKIPKMIKDLGSDKLREVNIVRSSGNSSDDSITHGNLSGQSPDVPKHGPFFSHESTANKSRSSTGNERDIDDIISSQTSVVSSQSSADSPIAQSERTESSLVSNSEEEPAPWAMSDKFSTSFVKLLQMAGTVLHGVYDKDTSGGNSQIQSESSVLDSQNKYYSKDCTSLRKPVSRSAPNLGEETGDLFDSIKACGKSSDASCGKGNCAEISGLSGESAPQTKFQKPLAFSLEERPMLLSPNTLSSNRHQINIPNKLENQNIQVPSQRQFQENNCEMQSRLESAICTQNLMDAIDSSSNINHSNKGDYKEVNSNKRDPDLHPGKTANGPKSRGRIGKEKINPPDWDNLRKQAQAGGRKRENTENTKDSVDWDAVRCADVNEIAQTIKERGMNNMLAERIKDFLNRLVREHESIDLEWLRDVPPDKAKEYLLSIRGLGLKSVECVRLLTLHHLAFPVDTNVGRIAVRLGWVPLQPLPESLQLHLLELYPVLESIQKYLWPRLCKLDQRTLYELHYQMITFGKVFCTKSKPNCNACPMKGECRHFASAFASARLALPAPEDKNIVSARGSNTADRNPIRNMNVLHLPSSPVNQTGAISGVRHTQPIIEEPASPEPTVEIPATPEPGYTQVSECDIENALYEDPEEIPTIKLNMEEFTQNLLKVMQASTELQNGDMSKALVALTPEAASIPVPKLKNVSRLRTEHQVYELPDSHPLLEGMDKREPDDPCPYLLAIWTPGETVNSIEPPERQCRYQEPGKLCMDNTCLACNSIREVNSQTVRGTLLIPCRTAMRGSFPLNGTYFQVNEVFSDHESSLAPMDVPRDWLWNLPRRTVYFGTSIPTIFKGLTTEGIQYCFWRGFVCVRGFDRKTRAPRPLITRLHFPASKLTKGKGKKDED